LEEVGEETVIHKIVEPVSEAWLEGVNEDDVEELPQYHGEILAGDELRELAEQLIRSDFTASDAEEETPVRELATEFLSNTEITQFMD
jgi:uncharacterized protein with von Willebrand factor type A (vWA) domain